MGAPHFDITRREKRNLSPNGGAPKEEAPKESDPTSEKAGAEENPLVFEFTLTVTTTF